MMRAKKNRKLYDALQDNKRLRKKIANLISALKALEKESVRKDEKIAELERISKAANSALEMERSRRLVELRENIYRG